MVEALREATMVETKVVAGMAQVLSVAAPTAAGGTAGGGTAPGVAAMVAAATAVPMVARAG